MASTRCDQPGRVFGGPPALEGLSPELPCAKLHTGTVKAWLKDHGFGFITPDHGGPDVFVHRNQLSDGHSLEKGASVTFECRLNPARGKYEALTCSTVIGKLSSAPRVGRPLVSAIPGASVGLEGTPSASEKAALLGAAVSAAIQAGGDKAVVACVAAAVTSALVDKGGKVHEHAMPVSERTDIVEQATAAQGIIADALNMPIRDLGMGCHAVRGMVTPTLLKQLRHLNCKQLQHQRRQQHHNSARHAFCDGTLLHCLRAELSSCCHDVDQAGSKNGTTTPLSTTRCSDKDGTDNEDPSHSDISTDLSVGERCADSGPEAGSPEGGKEGVVDDGSATASVQHNLTRIFSTASSAPPETERSPQKIPVRTMHAKSGETAPASVVDTLLVGRRTEQEEVDNDSPAQGKLDNVMAMLAAVTSDRAADPWTQGP